MIESLQEIIPRQYAQIPGLSSIQNFGWKLLWIGFVMSLGNEMFRAATGRGFSLVVPVVRTLIAGLLLNYMQQIGLWLDEVGTSLATSIGADAATLETFRKTWKATAKATSGFEWFRDLGLRSFIAACAGTLYIAMLGAKLWILEFLYPVRFCLALFGGLFAVPLGVFPKLRTLGPWLKLLVQIALWPIIFQFLMALSLSAFKGVIEEMNRIDVAALLGLVKGAPSPPEGSFEILLRFFLLSAGYIYIAFKTPRWAEQVMASEAAETMSGMVGAAVTAGAAFALRAATMGPAAAALGPTGALIGALRGGSSGGASGGDGGGASASAKGSQQAPDASMNQRSYRSPPAMEQS